MKGEVRERAFAHVPRFKQSDLDPPTGGCSNQRVRVGQSPPAQLLLQNTHDLILHIT